MYMAIARAAMLESEEVQSLVQAQHSALIRAEPAQATTETRIDTHWVWSMTTDAALTRWKHTFLTDTSFVPILEDSADESPRSDKQSQSIKQRHNESPVTLSRAHHSRFIRKGLLSTLLQSTSLTRTEIFELAELYLKGRSQGGRGFVPRMKPTHMQSRTPSPTKVQGEGKGKGKIKDRENAESGPSFSVTARQLSDSPICYGLFCTLMKEVLRPGVANSFPNRNDSPHSDPLAGHHNLASPSPPSLTPFQDAPPPLIAQQDTHHQDTHQQHHLPRIEGAAPARTGSSMVNVLTDRMLMRLFQVAAMYQQDAGPTEYLDQYGVCLCGRACTTGTGTGTGTAARSVSSHASPSYPADLLYFGGFTLLMWRMCSPQLAPRVTLLFDLVDADRGGSVSFDEIAQLFSQDSR
eukprot:TRINITY_DN4025_c0_g1::TRINITY_DN4025_c0_g1_i1::g.12018::m.12018 TRINITY_DN4025_c0_g1::TRINITY_DN4025_c0_g1_i1::g.12018  ORF type:complete len:408 (-),score=39.43,EF-hand_8/PF13833.1/9.4e+03,EF-hand_8/PF13833.1/0.087,EF-hand_1/PF00036.27/0.1,EF-hand_6/PF13405.1/0.25,EF-hand_5/PF13202.1/0.24 TRINITY_DN4025_c0_g1_i1:146-1369(-)